MKEGRIVITTSGTHDSENKTMIAPPKHADAKLLAFPEKDGSLENRAELDSGRSYSGSKFCNILTVRYLRRKFHGLNRAIQVLAYDPGPTLGTGLARNNKFLIRFLWKVFRFPLLRIIMPKMNSKKQAGAALARLASGEIAVADEQFYVSLRKERLNWHLPSRLAMDDQLMEKLWQDSEELMRWEVGA